jgi:hypothetical protein
MAASQAPFVLAIESHRKHTTHQTAMSSEFSEASADGVARIVVLTTTTNGVFHQFDCMSIHESGKMRRLTLEIECTAISDPAPTGRFDGYVFSVAGLALAPIDGPTMLDTVEQGDKRWTIWGSTTWDGPSAPDTHGSDIAQRSLCSRNLLAARLELYLPEIAPNVMEVATAMCASPSRDSATFVSR